MARVLYLATGRAGLESRSGEHFRFDAIGTVESIVHAVQRGDADAVVLDFATSVDVYSAIARAGVPILLRGSLDQFVLRRLPALGRAVAVGRISLVGRDDAVSDIADLLRHRHLAGPELRLVESASRCLPATARPPVLAACVLGRARAKMTDLARYSGIPLRTIQAQLARELSLAPSEVMGWSFALHVAWNIDVAGKTLKRIALESRYRSAAAMSDYVERHIGARPTAILESGGFEALLHRWCGRLRAASAARRTVAFDCAVRDNPAPGAASHNPATA